MLLAVLWPACLAAVAQAGLPREIPPSAAVAFVNVNVLPMNTGQVLERQTVVVRDGRVAELGPADSLEAPLDAELIQGEGCYLMPALADLHTHMVSGPNWENDLFLFIANGVTTVREMWGSSAFLRWREAIASGAALGPRLVLASPGMDGPTGRFAPYTPPITSPAQARQTVAQHTRAGYDFIKVYSDLTADVYAAIVEEARAQSIKVMGHIPTRVGLLSVLAAGQYSIEHLTTGVLGPSAGPLATAILDPSTIREPAGLVREAGVWVTPTLTVNLRSLDRLPALAQRPEMRFVSPEMKRWFQHPTNIVPNRDPSRLEANVKTALKALHDAGVKLVLGVDSGYGYVLPGFSIHDELRLTVEAGLTPYEALRLATVNAAEFLERQDEMGTLAVGKRADLILLLGNPLDDVGNANRRAGVMAGGRWFSEERLQERLEEIARLYGN